MLTRRIQQFIKIETLSGLVLLLSLSVALIIANSPLNSIYHDILDLPVQIRFGDLNLEKSFLLWVNEGLMAIFFLLLALEIKREVLEGDLSDISQMSLPIIAAIGGIAIPAIIYYALNYQDSEAVKGWPIPTTTDIAFVLGIVALLGRRVPGNLKVFLVALSIVDDILAIIIIAVAYTYQLSWLSLSLATIATALLISLNWLGIKRLAPYILLGIVTWIFVLKSNVHATLAGVVIGLAIPLRTEGSPQSPLRQLEHMLHPWVAFFILPLFVFMNGGIPILDWQWQDLTSPVSLGIASGLFLGKSIGVFGITAIVIALGYARLPGNCTWLQLYGMAALTGVGFTMSLFISTLAFNGTEFVDLARQGVLLGSLLSGSVAVLAFRWGKS